MVYPGLVHGELTSPVFARSASVLSNGHLTQPGIPRGKPREKHRKPWETTENHRKTIGKLEKNHGKMVAEWDLM